MWLRRYDPLLSADAFIRGPLLVVAPHPDDEVIGCGGLVAAHLARGVAVTAIIMTDGSLGDPRAGGAADTLVCAREAETRVAAQRIGGLNPVFFGLPDGHLSADTTAVARLRAEIRRLQPATLLFPSPLEFHPDHRATALFCLDAARAEVCPQHLMSYEVGAFQTGNVLIDITPWMATKEHAIAAYTTQLQHMDIVGKVQALNRARTVNVDVPGVTYVEAYTDIRRDAVDAWLAGVENLARLVEEMRG